MSGPNMDSVLGRPLVSPFGAGGRREEPGGRTGGAGLEGVGSGNGFHHWIISPVVPRVV